MAPTVLGLTADPQAKNKHHSSSLTMGSNARLDTISKRNHAAALEMETLLWRALVDSPEAAKEYLADDCVMINPFFSGGHGSMPMSKLTEPSINDALKAASKWTGFRFHGDPLVVEIDLMAVALVYKVSLFKHGRKGVKEVTASASSSWRQTAGADWLLCAMHVAWAEEEEEGEGEEGSE